MRRVVITAVGLVSPLGSTKEALWEGLCSGREPGVVALPNDLAGLSEKGDRHHLPERPDEPSVGARCCAQMVPVPFFPPPIARFGAGCGQFSGEIDDFGPLEKEQKKAIRKGLKVMCRECQMGVAAAQLALGDAGSKLGTLDPHRTGISFGTDYMVTVPEDFTEGIVECLDGQGRFDFSRWRGHGMTKSRPYGC